MPLIDDEPPITAPAWTMHPPLVHERFGLRLVVPIVLGAGQRIGERRGHMYEDAPVLRPGLERQHLDPDVLG